MINFCKGRANGLRMPRMLSPGYPRWGGRRNTVRPEKYSGVENCLESRHAQRPQRRVRIIPVIVWDALLARFWL